MESKRNQIEGDGLVDGKLQSIHSFNYSFVHSRNLAKAHCAQSAI